MRLATIFKPIQFTPIQSFFQRKVNKYKVSSANVLRAMLLFIHCLLEISVNPESITARPGSTVRFFCSVTLQDGRAPRGGTPKVMWFRVDRQPLTAGREEIITGTTSRNVAILVVKHIDWEHNDVEYVCSDGVSLLA